MSTDNTMFAFVFARILIEPRCGLRPGRDVAKLTVSNVSAQAVQANIAPHAQSVSEDSDQQQSDSPA